MHSLQGDILGLQDGAGTMVVYYRYDAWGRLTSQYGSLVATLGSLNPFRYRGYVYDEETALYYLRSRYYNPWWGRFISTDSILGQVGGLLQHNPFIYCGNNPIIHIDIDGDFWDTAFDIISLGVSIAEVVVNPTDPWAWLGLAGNFIDLIPFVTGVGETTRAIKMTVSLADGATDVISDARKSYHALSKLANADMLINATGSYEIVFES